ncbi:MAG: tRNA 2-selenouridine(34) synthase MnmH, partial [Flavobacteriales bacterium]|nr:tRNA 2-selenouridine(34) synthase MnmH [Flavobacteriales bacterium]
MIHKLNIHDFIDQSTDCLLVDVRTPKEFENGHLKDAINLPLFSNEERAIVGTLYKQKGRQEAILKGLEIVGPKLSDFITKIKPKTTNNKVFLYCWRGGMRSGSLAWLFEMYGFKTHVLINGYKSYRKWVIDKLKEPINFIVLGGKTGSSKSYILRELKKMGVQILDLEKLANHKGSAFGHLGEDLQPTQEAFENELANAIHELNKNKITLIEDESRLIGNKIIPENLWDSMRTAKVFYIELPFDERVKHLLKDYGTFDKELLEKSILKISKRMGPEQTKDSLAALHQNDL